MSTPASVLNELFNAHLDSSSGKEKIAAVAQTYVRDKLRENSFARKIIPPQIVTKNDMQVSTQHDTLVYIDEIEPNSRAMTITFRGQPRARFIRAARYEIPIFTISSEKFEKTEQELLAYRMPITESIKKNSVKDIQEIEDHRFLTYAEAAVQATGQIVRGQQAVDDAAAFGAGNGLRGTLLRGDLIKLFQELDGKRRRLEKVLINEHDWDSVLSWTIEDFGDSVQSKVVIEGFTYSKIMGRMFTRTVKTDILQSGNLYGFTSPQFLGKFLILNNTKFYLDKIANVITWQSWEDIGMAFGNVASLAKLELYNGQGGGNDASDPLINEEDVGTKVYNQADNGITFPQVSAY